MSGNAFEESKWLYKKEYICPSSSNEDPPLPVETSKKKKKKKNKNKKKSVENDGAINATNNFEESDEFLLSPEGELLIDGPSNYNFEDAEKRIDLFNQNLKLLDIRSAEAREEIERFKTFHELKKKQKQQEEQKRLLLQLQQEDPQQGIMNNNKPVEVPPIYTYNLNANELISICRFAIGETFNIELLGKERYALRCETMEQHETMKKIFEHSKKEFSLTIKDIKYHRVALYGLCILMPQGELLEKLRKHECNDLKFDSAKSFISRRGLSYLIRLTYKSNPDLLRKIDVIDGLPVTWEEYVLQCTNCQQFGHRGSRCKAEPRCVKCAMNHHTDECPIKKVGFLDVRFKCVLCNATGHTADSKHCPEFKAMFLKDTLMDNEALSLSSAQSVQELGTSTLNEAKCNRELSEYLNTVIDEVKSLSLISQDMSQSFKLLRSEVLKRSK